jgi:tetratricopeptide (TPR) repeat protein
MKDSHVKSYLIVFVLCVIFISSTTYSANKANDKKEEELYAQREKCISLMNERTAAYSAEDWINLERLSRNYISCCKKVHDPRNIANAYGDIACANNELKKYNIALKESNKGIIEYYAETGCHIQKVVALIGLKRLKEAIEELKIAEKLAIHIKEENQRDLNNSNNSEQDNELYRSRDNLYDAQLGHIKALKDNLGITEED